MELPAGVSPEEFDESYRAGLRIARATVARRGFDDETAEALNSAVGDALIWAIGHYDAAAGSFQVFALAAMRRFFTHTIASLRRRDKGRPGRAELDDEFEGALECRRPDSAEAKATINDLPAELSDAVRLYFVDGYTMRECGLLLGCSPDTVRRRLHQAAHLLAPGMAAPRRETNAKHFRRGRSR